MPPRSKRQRKQKDRVSLKGKQRALGQNILDADNELDPNAVILPAKPVAPKDDTEDADVAPQLSKSQQRKLRKIQEEKERREKRAEIMETLNKHQMQGDQLGLLRPVSARGQKETKKNALKRALQLQRAGIDIPQDVQLFKERKAPAEEDSEEEESEDEERRPSAVGKSKHAPFQKKAPARADESSEESGSEDEEEEDAAPSPKRQKFSAAVAAAAKRQTAAATKATDLSTAAAGMSAADLRAAVAQAKAEIGDEIMLDHRDEEDEPQIPKRPVLPVPSGPARVVLVERAPEIELIRTNLPIVAMEQEIMESIAENDVIVLCGETGCGKTTQVPQFLYEAGYGSAQFPERAGVIGVTQPRRVAAVSTAGRVAEELGSKLGDLVGYQVRYDKKVGDTTSLKFMTDGILLREVQEDFILRKYSAIVVDEAHERSLNTDILLGMLSRIVALRRNMSSAAGAADGGVHPLKLIIMSATLRTEDFVGNRKLFTAPPPIVSVPARQFPVTVHFSRRTELHDYVSAAYRKTCQIHRNLPPGGILVFLTGQREVEYLCRRLRKTFSRKKKVAQQAQQESGVNKEQQEEDAEKQRAASEQDGGIGDWAAAGGEDAAEADASAAADEALLLAALEDERTGAADRDDFNDEDADASDEEDRNADEDEVVILGEGFTPEQIAEAEKKFDEQFTAFTSAVNAAKRDLKTAAENAVEDQDMPVHVLPLYAMLAPALQARVFKPPPPGSRLIIVATNVAETSLTIPGIRYVVDAGRSKQKLLENAAGMAKFEVRWVSKASAEQRAGRAGRTGPGHCYRLYSSAHYNDTFPQHTPPEIANTALEGVALSLKALGVDRVVNFPFPTAPAPTALTAAERCLIALGALDSASGRLTDLGAAMARYPISPRHARMLLEAMKGAEDAAIAAAEISRAVEDKKKKKKDKGNKVTEEVVLRYAVGLAAVMSVESPFVNIGSIGSGGGQSQEDKGGEEQDEAAAAEEKARKEANKKERGAAAAAHAALRVPESDALSALCALCAFEAAGESEAFCRANYLLYKNLREAAALRKQLSRLVASQRTSFSPLGSSATDHSPPPAPPPPQALEALRRSVAAGWGDQVARRVRSLEHVQSQAAAGKKGRAVRYRSCGTLEEDIFLHPNSALHTTAPDYVVYSEVVRTVKRPYMAGLTAVEPRWLATAAAPMCTFSAPLLDPPPFFSPAADAVLCWQDVTFGKHDWPLPRHAAPHPELSERCAVFAAALLEGKVVPSMAKLRSSMAVPSSMAAKPEMRVHRRVADLIAALEKRKVDSKAGLAAAWKKDSEFLKIELGAWMQKGGQSKLNAVWPGLLAECLQK